MQTLNINFVVTYDLCSETNIAEYPDTLKTHDHEEADTLLILQAIDVATSDPFAECVIFSPDTDVFLLLIHYSEILPQVTTYCIYIKCVRIKISFKDKYYNVGF